jgi:hypothetical protein
MRPQQGEQQQHARHQQHGGRKLGALEGLLDLRLEQDVDEPGRDQGNEDEDPEPKRVVLAVARRDAPGAPEARPRLRQEVADLVSVNREDAEHRPKVHEHLERDVGLFGADAQQVLAQHEVTGRRNRDELRDALH